MNTHELDLLELGLRVTVFLTLEERIHVEPAQEQPVGHGHSRFTGWVVDRSIRQLVGGTKLRDRPGLRDTAE
jgi:hypothetical protein